MSQDEIGNKFSRLLRRFPPLHIPALRHTDFGAHPLERLRLCEDIQFGTLFQVDVKEFTEIVIVLIVGVLFAYDEFVDFAVGLDTHGFEEDDDGDVFGDTVLVEVHFTL